MNFSNDFELVELQARYMALENLFFGYMASNESPDLVEGNKRMLDDFTLENLKRYLTHAPDSPDFESTKEHIQKTVRELEARLE